MNILFLSKNGSSLGLAERVRKEGHHSPFFVVEKDASAVGEGIVNKPDFDLPLLRSNEYPIISNIHKLLDNASPDVVVFDMVGLGRIADEVKKSGIPVLGACFWADNAELDREYGYRLMKQVGIRTPVTVQFTSGQWEEAVKYVQKNKGKRYVYKPSGNIETSHTYVAQGTEDMCAMLELWKDDGCEFEIQEYIEGTEVSCELWWNGLHAVMHNLTFEEKQFMDNGVGPTVGCAGNVVRMVPSTCKLVQDGIGKMERLLKKTTYRGPIDLNSIVNDSGLYGLEFTVRFGYDAVQALFEIHKGSVTELLHSVATGRSECGEFSGDYSLSVRLSIPPYPHSTKDIPHTPILGVDEGNEKHIWWGDVRKVDGRYECAGTFGDVGSVVARGREVEECRRRVYKTISNLTIPQCQYRSDIGQRVKVDERKLKQMGYL